MWCFHPDRLKIWTDIILDTYLYNDIRVNNDKKVHWKVTPCVKVNWSIILFCETRDNIVDFMMDKSNVQKLRLPKEFSINHYTEQNGKYFCLVCNTSQCFKHCVPLLELEGLEWTETIMYYITNLININKSEVIQT
jgi:hypothetical protein